MDIPEQRFLSRQEVMQDERIMLDNKVENWGPLFTPILLDIRELLGSINEKLNKGGDNDK